MGRRAVLARLWWTYCLSPGPGRPARKRFKPSIFDRRDHHDAGRISSRDHAQQHRLPGANPQSNPDGKLLSSGFKKRFKPQRSYGCFNHMIYMGLTLFAGLERGIARQDHDQLRQSVTGRGNDPLQQWQSAAAAKPQTRNSHLSTSLTRPQSVG